MSQYHFEFSNQAVSVGCRVDHGLVQALKLPTHHIDICPRFLNCHWLITQITRHLMHAVNDLYLKFFHPPFKDVLVVLLGRVKGEILHGRLSIVIFIRSLFLAEHHCLFGPAEEVIRWFDFFHGKLLSKRIHPIKLIPKLFIPFLSTLVIKPSYMEDHTFPYFPT